MASRETSFFGELRRRNVYRVGIAYVIASWLLLQVIDVVEPIIGMPEWVPKFVLALLAFGLPLALLFAWAYEMTPDGIKREADVDRTSSITRETGQRLNRIIIGVLVIAVAMLLIERSSNDGATDAAALIASQDISDLETSVDESVTSDAAVGPSIAVLPFVNMSADESSAYFSDGLADTLLHMLAQIREIRVAARTSSFQFRDQNTDITEIANALNVGTILEGSVQRAGNKVRVTAQLIEADTGYHLWSGNYDRNLDDIFAIQDEIANEVVAALKVSLLGDSAERLAHRETENLEAYTEFLLGVDDFANNSFDSLAKAEVHFREAVRLDPNYALAWTRLGNTYLQMEDTGAGSFDEMIENARDAASRALEIDENLAAAIAVLGNAERRLGNRELSEKLLVRAIEVGPNDILAKQYYAQLLWGQLRVNESMAVIDEVLVLDPLSAEAHFQRSVALSLVGDYEGGIAQARRMVAINPNSPTGHYREAQMQFRLGNWATAAMKAMEAQEIDTSDPELPMLIAHYYLAMELPNDAERWFDRANEIDAAHPVSRAASLAIYLYNNDVKSAAKLARQLLDEGIDDRQLTHELILRAIWKDAAATGRYREALDYLRDHFPRLFEDNPEWHFDDRFTRVAIGSMMMAAGDEKHGRPLLEETLDRADKAAVEFGPWLLGVQASNGLGDKRRALQRFLAYASDPYSPDFWPITVRGAPDFELLLDEPEYIAWVEGLKENAAKQRILLAELLSAD